MNINLSVKIPSQGGHTEVSFGNGEATIEWKETSLAERKGLVALVEGAKKNGFETFSVDEGGASEVVKDALPAVFFNRAGKLTLKGANADVKLIAKGLIDSEIASGKFVLELDEENAWCAVSTKDFAVKTDGTAQKVMVSPKQAGG